MKNITKCIGMTFLLLTLVFGGLYTISFAAIPHLINYQGRLTDSSGTPLNGSYSLNFKIYDAETAGNLLWQETHSGVIIQKGIFAVLLGSVINLNLSFDNPYFLEIKVGNEVMSPRQRVTSSAYAIRAETAEGVSGITNFFPASGNVGIGIVSPADKFDVNGSIAINSKRVIDSSGNWVGNPTNLIGPAGPQGPPGTQGPQGAQGPPGPAVNTSAACGYTGGCGVSSPVDAMYYCSGICNGSSNVVVAKCGPCSVTSDTGSCNVSTNNVCCVCKP